MGVADFKGGLQVCRQIKKWELKQVLADLNLILLKLNQRGLTLVKF